MNLAIIDIGTLKVKLLIARVGGESQFEELYKSNTLTCFGCELEANGWVVKKEYIERTMAELRRCCDVMREHEVQRCRVVATQAMRNAKNGQAIRDRIKHELGLEVELITQQREAEVFYEAVMHDFEGDGQYAVVDVGGGSVQVLIGTPKQLQRAHLMKSGSQYLHDKVVTDSVNPASRTTEADIETITELVRGELQELEPMEGVPLVYGSSNVIDLMKALNIPLQPHANSVLHPYTVEAADLQHKIVELLPMTFAQREASVDFQRGYMYAVDKAFINILEIAQHLGSPYIVPSNANIAKGFIFEMADTF
jgi:exopolyphosphatase/guanosine-5'-triphosphate,3'-diphosphate pyrophosphatase